MDSTESDFQNSNSNNEQIVLKKIGQYKLKKEIGRGAFATVYKAEDDTKKIYAIKQIFRKNLNQKLIDALEKEINILKSINSECIIKLYEVKKTKKNYYLVLEYCAGGDLHKFLKKRKRISEHEIQRIIYQLSNGFRVLYQNDIIHRDIKLSNLLFLDKTPNSLVKIADFGFAKWIQSESAVGTFCGTPPHMAPEILANLAYNRKVDLYSVGTVIYQLIFGRIPFLGSSPVEVLNNINMNSLEFQNDIIISPFCKELITLLLKKDPLERIDYPEFFNHIFVKTVPQEYANLLIKQFGSLVEVVPCDAEETNIKKVTSEFILEEKKQPPEAKEEKLEPLNKFEESTNIDISNKKTPEIIIERNKESENSENSQNKLEINEITKSANQTTSNHLINFLKEQSLLSTRMLELLKEFQNPSKHNTAIFYLGIASALQFKQILSTLDYSEDFKETNDLLIVGFENTCGKIYFTKELIQGLEEYSDYVIYKNLLQQNLKSIFNLISLLKKSFPEIIQTDQNCLQYIFNLLQDLITYATCSDPHISKVYKIYCEIIIELLLVEYFRSRFNDKPTSIFGIKYYMPIQCENNILFPLLEDDDAKKLEELLNNIKMNN